MLPALALALSCAEPAPAGGDDSAVSDTAGGDTAGEATHGTLPRIVPTYFVGGFDSSGYDAVLADPGQAGVLMLAGFDLIVAMEDAGDGSWSIELDTARIDAVHAAGLRLYVDVSSGWAPVEFWSDGDALSAFLLQLVEAGVDGVDFDELGTRLRADDLVAFMEQARALNPVFRTIVTQVSFSELTPLLEDGARPDYVAMAWYLAGRSGFRMCTSAAEEYGVRCAYWVDPSTYDRIDETYSDAGTVLLWNLCWQSSTCGSEHEYLSWVPWADVRPLLQGLDPFEDP